MNKEAAIVRYLLTASLALVAFVLLFPATLVYDEGRSLDSLVWFALAACFIGFAHLANTVLKR